MRDDDSHPFDGRLGFGRRPGLVVVDMVNAYTDPNCALYLGRQVHDAVASIGRLVDGARSASIPVVYTGVEVSEDGAANGIFYRKVPAISIFRDPHFGGLVPELDPLASEPVIMKHYPSALCGTSLAPMLFTAGVDSMVICGVSTSGCIRATATDAMQHGFVPLVVREAVADRDPATHDSNLFDIDAKVGDVVTEADALAHFASI
ncbi:MAG: isochorismatase family protein [Ilumatobacter sp.]